MAGVQYAPKLTFGLGAVEEGVGINIPRMREERAAKVKTLMKRDGIPTLLVTGMRNVRYLTGFFWRDFQPGLSYILFFADHDPVIFAHAGSYQQAPEQMPWIKHWRPGRSWLQELAGHEAASEEAELFAKEIHHELQERGLAKEKVGIVCFDDLAKQTLRSKGVKLVEASSLLMEAATIKTPDEINCHKIVASMCSAGWQTVIDVVRPGLTEAELRMAIMNTMARAGSETPRCGIWSGPMSFERGMSPFARRIEYGDLMYVALCGNHYMGYVSCLYRSFIVGRQPTDKERDWFKRLKDRLDSAIIATKVGNTTADAAKAYEVASRWGYKDEVEVLSIEMGHGIGMVGLSDPVAVPYNKPIINRQWSLKHPQPFEEGMVIAYESAEGEHRIGGVRMENTVVITKNGAEVIDHFKSDEIMVI